MAVVACLLLLLSCSIAGQAMPTSSSPLANKTPSAMHGTAELDSVLVKRTSSRSPSHRHGSRHVRGTRLQPASSSPPTPHVLVAADHRHQTDLSMATPSQVPAVGPSAPHHKQGNLNMMSYKVGRRPRGSLTNNPTLKAQAAQENRLRMMAKIKSGVLVNKTKPDGSKYAIATFEEYKRYNRDSTRESRSRLTIEQKARLNQKQNERKRRDYAKRKAQRDAQLKEGGRQGSPLRQQGRSQQEQERAGPVEARQHASVLSSMEGEGSAEHAPPDFHGSDTLRLRKPESTSASSSLLPFLLGAQHRPVSPGPSLSLDLRLSLPTSGSSTSGQGETRPSRPAAPPTAGTVDQERLRLSLAPPGQHDRLRLTLAPPRHD